jgi:hypothetical protein
LEAFLVEFSEVFRTGEFSRMDALVREERSEEIEVSRMCLGPLSVTFRRPRAEE